MPERSPLHRLLASVFTLGLVLILANPAAEASTLSIRHRSAATLITPRIVPTPRLRPPRLTRTITVQRESDRAVPLALRHPDIGDRERQTAAVVLRTLPFCAPLLKHFVVRYEANAHRGLGGGSTIIVKGIRSASFPAGVPETEFASVVVHECAHLYVSAKRGAEAAGTSAFADGHLPIHRDSSLLAYFRISWDATKVRRREAQRNDFCSGYGFESDPHEDLADCVTLALLHRRAFVERARVNPILAAKLAWIDQHPLAGITPLPGSGWDGTIPWDVTKLPHALLATRIGAATTQPQMR